jgi:uncharacterized protein YcaQ
LFSRRPQYRPHALKRLYENDRALFEHWTHDAAVVPIDFYPYWHLRRQRDAEMLRNRWRNWQRDGFKQQCQPVTDMIRDQGPMCSTQVGAACGQNAACIEAKHAKSRSKTNWNGSSGLQASRPLRSKRVGCKVQMTPRAIAPICGTASVATCHRITLIAQKFDLLA